MPPELKLAIGFAILCADFVTLYLGVWWNTGWKVALLPLGIMVAVVMITDGIVGIGERESGKTNTHYGP